MSKVSSTLANVAYVRQSSSNRPGSPTWRSWSTSSKISAPVAACRSWAPTTSSCGRRCDSSTELSRTTSPASRLRQTDMYRTISRMPTVGRTRAVRASTCRRAKRRCSISWTVTRGSSGLRASIRAMVRPSMRGTFRMPTCHEARWSTGITYSPRGKAPSGCSRPTAS